MNLFRRLQRGGMIAAALTLLFSAQVMAEAQTEAPAEAAYEEIDEDIRLAVDGMEFKDLEVASSNAFGMTITSEDADLEDGLAWKLHFENRSNEDLSVSFANTAINGWMCPTDEWGTTGWSIAAGEETDAEVNWTAGALETIGADAVDTVTFSLKAYVLKDGNYSYFANSIVTVDFGTEDASEVELPEELDVIMDNSEYHFGILEYGTDDSGLPEWTVYMRNDSSEVSLFEIKNTVLNGFASDPYWSEIVLPGFKSLTKIDFWNLDMAESGIGAVTDASFKIRVWKEASTGYNSFVDPVDEEGVVTIEVVEDDTESAEPAEDEFEDETVLYDEDGVKLAVTKIGYAEDQSYYAVGLHLVNDSSSSVKANITSVRMNGKDAYQEWSREAAGGTWLTGLITVDGKMLEKMKVDDVESVSMDFVLTDADGNTIADETYQLTGDDSLYADELEEAEEESAAEPEIVLAEETEEATTEAQQIPETEEATTEAQQTPETEEEATEAQQTAETETEAAVTEAEETSETEAAQTEEEQTEKSEEAATEAATLPAADDEEETEAATEKEDVPAVVFTDEKTVRMVQAVLVDAGVELEKDGQITDALKDAIKDYRSKNGLAEGTDIDDELLFKMGITDSDTLQKIQKALNDLGYECGEPDGLTGDMTRDSIALYRKEHEQGEGQKIDAELIEALGITRSGSEEEEAAPEATEEKETEAKETEAEETEAKETEAKETETEKATEKEAAAAGTGKEYTDEKTVRIVQAALISYGFELEKDGAIGNALNEAVSGYRSDKGLTEGTAIDDELLFSLGVTDSETLEKVQKALNDLGYDCGEPDGLTGQKTKDAISAYREKENLAGSGIDQAFLDALKISR